MSPYNPIPAVSSALETSARELRFLCPTLKVGGDERVRTDDPLLAKQVLSQLSYTPTVIPAFVLLPFESACAPSKLYSAIYSNTNLFSTLP